MMSNTKMTIDTNMVFLFSLRRERSCFSAISTSSLTSLTSCSSCSLHQCRHTDDYLAPTPTLYLSSWEVLLARLRVC